jgi:hypothetical protein
MGTKHPTSIDALIDEFVREHRYLPDDAVTVSDKEQLTPRLQRRIENIPHDATWHAWTDGHRVWLIIAQRACATDAFGAKRTVLEMSFHDQDGVCVATGAWVRRWDRKWLLYRVPAEADDDSIFNQSVPILTNEASLRRH